MIKTCLKELVIVHRGKYEWCNVQRTGAMHKYYIRVIPNELPRNLFEWFEHYVNAENIVASAFSAVIRLDPKYSGVSSLSLGGRGYFQLNLAVV